MKNAELKDGLLSIELVREIPDEMKPKKIEIGSSQARIADQSERTANQNRTDEVVAA